MLKTHKSLDTVHSASSDGAPNMTGDDNGALRLLERKLERPIQRIVCISHGVELSLRKVFEDIGNTLKLIINYFYQQHKIIYSRAWLIQVRTRNIKLKRKFGIDPNRSEYNNHSDFDMWLHVDTDLGLVQMNKKCPLKVKYIATFHRLCQVCQCAIRKKRLYTWLALLYVVLLVEVA